MIEIEGIDEYRTTVITVSCYRETWRLERVLRTYLKALTLARKDGRDEVLSSMLAELHDAKGILRATWNDEVWLTDNAGEPDVPVVWLDVERAWTDECEALVHHVVGNMQIERNPYDDVLKSEVRK